MKCYRNEVKSNPRGVCQIWKRDERQAKGEANIVQKRSIKKPRLRRKAKKIMKKKKRCLESIKLDFKK